MRLLIVEITKRNGNIVSFDINRIINAINKASLDTMIGIDDKLSKRIADSIKKDLSEQKGRLTVENIQDMVEQKLMASNRKDIAKQYILYRDVRNKNRNIKESKYKLLDDEFISKYKHLPNPMSPLGEFVYYRTYSRWLPNEKRREFWWETCRRAIEFNCGLVEGTTKEEAQQLFDNMFNLRQFLSGRTLWSGGISTAYTNPISQFNCSGIVIDSFSVYKDMCYLLMLGCGVGFSVESQYVSQLPKVRNNVQVVHKTYNAKQKYTRKEITDYSISGNVMELNIGDSKNGWCMAIDLFLKVFYDNDFKSVDTMVVNYDNVRPYGEPLKTFGGKSSGHEALLLILQKIQGILMRDNTGMKKLKSIDALDIGNIIAEGIVVGGVRRSAQLCLFDANDQEVMNAKTNLYMMDDKGIWNANREIVHRMMSNNSIAYHTKPTLDELKSRFETIKISAEGNFFNLEVAKKRNPNTKITNPCFAGDMRLLTVEGYRHFDELEGKQIEIINKDGHISESTVWCGGTREVIKLTFSNNKFIKCTPDHIFMLEDGSECVASKLLNKKVKLYDIHNQNEIFNPSVVCIELLDEEVKVYDFNEPLSHWGVVEGVVVHNCGEILLDSKQFCNLTTINIMAFVENGIVNIEKLIQAQRLSARAGFRNATVELELSDWNIMQMRDRLIGCSMTGYQDMVNSTIMSKEEQVLLLKQLKEVAIEEADSYAESININKSLLKTCVKPEGSLSLLPTVSSGVHFSHSPYYIRRVRINSSDPLCKVCEELGYPIFPENGQIIETCTTKVIEFPVKAPDGKTKYNVSAIEQLEIYKMFMDNYVEHNASNTISVKPHEWNEVIQWVYDNWDSVIGITFINLDDSFYKLLPYEAITEEEYNKRVFEMKPFVPSLISKYEIEEMELDMGNSECVGGSCPIR